MRFSDALDIAAMAAISAGFGSRFGWWLSAVVAGSLTLSVNFFRSSDK